MNQNDQEVAFERLLQTNLACVETLASKATRVAHTYGWIPGFERRDQHRYLFAAQIFVVVACG